MVNITMINSTYSWITAVWKQKRTLWGWTKPRTQYLSPSVPVPTCLNPAVSNIGLIKHNTDTKEDIGWKLVYETEDP
jgi:hypothetical protein